MASTDYVHGKTRVWNFIKLPSSVLLYSCKRIQTRQLGDSFTQGDFRIHMNGSHDKKKYTFLPMDVIKDAIFFEFSNGPKLIHLEIGSGKVA